jgi:hypothetical protein
VENLYSIFYITKCILRSIAKKLFFSLVCLLCNILLYNAQTIESSVLHTITITDGAILYLENEGIVQKDQPNTETNTKIVTHSNGTEKKIKPSPSIAINKKINKVYTVKNKVTVYYTQKNSDEDFLLYQKQKNSFSTVSNHSQWTVIQDAPYVTQMPIIYGKNIFYSVYRGRDVLFFSKHYCRPPPFFLA